MKNRNTGASDRLPFGAEAGRVAANDDVKPVVPVGQVFSGAETLSDNTNPIGLPIKSQKPVRVAWSAAGKTARSPEVAKVVVERCPELRKQAIGLVRTKRLKLSANNQTVTLSLRGAPLLTAYVANNCLARLKGLFAYPPLSPTQALILSPCSAVHTVGMKYTIDVAFLSRRGFILKIVTLAPCSIAHCRDGHYAVEMAGGTATRLGLQVGHVLEMGL